VSWCKHEILARSVWGKSKPTLFPSASAYATANGTVMTFTRAMAKEFGPRNIRVNSLCPGMINTSFNDTFTKDEMRANVAGVNLDINGGLNYS